MRPTGNLHLGHLAGTLTNWVRLQEEYECFFMVADWHALMGEYERPGRLAEYSLENVADWISFGIDPKRSVVFVQSRVPEHLELFMVFSCLTPLGWLERCPTYKEQLRETSTRELNTYGFLGYPVLQAADILLYRADRVPVGEDQLPHLELTREIARRFNALYKTSLFPEPKEILAQTPKLLGLDRRKMSKSYANTIDLADGADAIRAKVQSMITDPQRIRRADPGHPEVCMVYDYYTVFSPESSDSAARLCRNAEIGCTQCKNALAEKLIALLAPFQEKRRRLLGDKAELARILEAGREKAGAAAAETMRDVRKLFSYGI